MLDPATRNEAINALRNALEQKGYNVQIAGDIANTSVQIISNQLGEGGLVPNGAQLRDVLTQAVRSAQWNDGGELPEGVAEEDVLQSAVNALCDVLI